MLGSSNTGSPDWLKCRNWLGEISPPSARSVKKVSSERELFLYLKDGTELCRIVGVLTQGRVPEEMVYRTQNFRPGFLLKLQTWRLYLLKYPALPDLN